MAPESSLPTTNPQGSATNRSDKTSLTVHQSKRLNRFGHIFTGAWALAAAIVTVASGGLFQKIEYQTQTLFFEMRGRVTPPQNILILAIDDESLAQGRQIYQSDPKKYAYLEPLQQWPWKREAYARAIERLMAAGARSVAVDVLFDTPSRYGAADDKKLQQTLQRYAGRVTLATMYESVQTRQGSSIQLVQPESQFLTEPLSVGLVNYPLEANGQIRRFGSEYKKLLARVYEKQFKDFDPLQVKMFSSDFDRSTLQAAKINIPQPKGEYIYFYGPNGTFDRIPFFYVLDPNTWNSFQAQVKDKIILIGPTANELKDFHKAPFAQTWLNPEPISGIEIHANAIATLMEGKAIAQAIPNAPLQGVFVFVGVLGAGIFISKRKRAIASFGWAIGIAFAWVTVSYLAFTYAQLMLPTAVPMIAIALGGVTYLSAGFAKQQAVKGQLRTILKRYSNSPIIQQIISQHDDLQDLLPLQDTSMASRLIGGRYQLTQVLGAGGFGETYIAQDTQRPGKPSCVVKQLKPASNDPKHLALARRLFPREAEALEKLGQHSQIPQLLAYFEEGEEFYLVQEFIAGHPLEQELLPGRQLLEAEVIVFLKELMDVLEFVHGQGVIHRDIKPNNIIRRHSDNKLVLIDFGAVKEVTTQLLDNDEQSRFTVGIGTQGYAPPEQCAGRPRPNSDIYAVGITAIKALTGLSPSQLHQDVKTGEILWTHKTQIAPELAAIVSKMVCYDFTQRYQSASEVKQALAELRDSSSFLSLKEQIVEMPYEEDLGDEPTTPWSEVSETIYPLEQTDTKTSTM